MEQIQKGLERFLEREVGRTEGAGDDYEEEAEDAGGCGEDEEPEDGDDWEDGEPEDGDDWEDGEPEVGDDWEDEEPEDGDMGKQSGKKGKKKKSFLKRLVILLAVLAVVFLAGMYLLVGVVYQKMRYEEAAGLAGKPVKSDGVTSILLIGSDSRDAGAEGRSDAMILLSVSNRTRTVHMTSLLRDMYVEIPGHEGNRLNAAYAFGGPQLLLETIQQNFGIEVNRYVVVNFQAFASLVDAVGGVDLELSQEEVQWVNAYLNEYNMLRDMPMETDYLDTSLSGLIHLNGAQSLAYSRNRYIGTDFGRTERQRKVLSEVLKRLPAAAVRNPGELVNGLFPNLTTNLTQMECMQLGLQAGKLLTWEIVQDSIPLEGTWSNADIRGMAVLQVDFDRNREYIRKEIYGK